MGYGTYSNDFDGRGSTFIVTGCLDEDQDALDAHEEDLHDFIAAAADAVGFSVEKLHGGRWPRAPFDPEFVAVAHNGVVVVGWRTWVSDQVVAVGPTNRISERLDLDAERLVYEAGRAEKAYANDYSNLVDMADEYFRLCLQSEGLECRYKTSGYTSAKYKAPENLDARIEELREKILAATENFSLSRGDALLKLGADERAEVVRTGREARGYSYGGGKVRYDTLVVVPFVDKRAGCIRGFAPQMLEDAPETDGLVFEMVIPDDLRDFMMALPGDEASAIPRVPETEAFFRERQAKDDISVVVSAWEFAGATGEEVAVDLPDVGDAKNRSAVLAEAPEVSLERAP
jgi:hypothetical protein